MISVIILSYNTRDITLKCLECLERAKGPEKEIIVVDNASSDGSAEAVAESFPSLRLIKNSENVGFAKGNNQAMALARGDWLLLLNSDVYVFENTLKKISDWVLKNPQADVVGCKLLNKDGTLQQSWGYFPTLRRISQMMLLVDNLPIVRDLVDSIHVRSELRYARDTQVDWVTGAFVLLKREVWEKVGGLDEKFFMYGEEIEWMHRIKKAGYQVWFSTAAQAIHLVGQSSLDRTAAVIGEMKGWLYWFSKYGKPWERKVLPYVIAAGCLLRMMFKPASREQYRQAFKEILKR